MQKKTVLIYDDEEEIRQICQIILTNECLNVEALASCNHLYEDIERIKPDVILMDLFLPGFDGEEAINSLRKNDKTKDIPIILFSAINNLEKIFKRVNADAFVEKPFDISTLRQIVSKCIK